MEQHREAAVTVVVVVQPVTEQMVPHSHVVEKIGTDTLGAHDPRPRPDHTAQGSSTKKVDSHYFWL